MVSKHHSSTTTLVSTEPESQMETLGVSCWDFAYSTGKCNLQPTKNCFFSKQPKSKHHERFILQTIIPAHDMLKEGPPQHTSQSGFLNKSKKRGSKHSDNPELRTYLVSSPSPASISCPQTYSTISTLLSTPNTRLIYLVPQLNIVCPKVCEMMRLPRAMGSSFQILPVPLEIEMRSKGGQESCSIVDALGIEEVVAKVLKNTTVRSFDGYVAFEDEREAWTFLEHVGKGVRSAAKKG